MLSNDRSGRAAAAVVLLLLILALIAYGVYWYSQNQLPKMLSEKAKLATTQNQPGASGQKAAGQSAAGGAAVPGGAPAAEAPKPVTVEFAVTGMTCDDCSKAIETELIKLDGVSTVSADWKSGSTKVQYNPAKCTNEQLLAAIEKLGYKAELKKDEPKAPATTG
jgi:copper chaperone CopZ